LKKKLQSHKNRTQQKPSPIVSKLSKNGRDTRHAKQSCHQEEWCNSSFQRMLDYPLD